MTMNEHDEIRALLPLRGTPSDVRVARFVEERDPRLDDRLVTAVEVLGGERQTVSPTIADPLLADAAQRAGDVDVDTVVPAESLRRAGFQAAAASLALAAVMFMGRGPAREAVDAASLMLFPEHVTLNVAPGNARIRAGNPLTIEAGLVGNRAPVVPQVEIGGGDARREANMVQTANGRFRFAVDAVTAPFTYRVVAGGRPPPGPPGPPRP